MFNLFPQFSIFLFFSVERKPYWKRSTIETQIQVVNNSSSLRDRQANHLGTTCNLIKHDSTPAKFRTDSEGSPLYIQNGLERQKLKIKYISCDEDNNPIES